MFEYKITYMDNHLLFGDGTPEPTIETKRLLGENYSEAVIEAYNWFLKTEHLRKCFKVLSIEKTKRTLPY